MKHVEPRPYADPGSRRPSDRPARGQHRVRSKTAASAEKSNAPFLFTLKGSGSKFRAGLAFAAEKGWLTFHESGTYVRLLPVDNLLK